MKKGFTLIELLAVIVILAIIAVIAVPIVLNIINDNKEGATLRGAENYLESVNFARAQYLQKNPDFKPSVCLIQADGNLICDEEYYLEVDASGDIPNGGTIIFKDNNISEIELTYEKSVVVYDKDSKVKLGQDFAANSSVNAVYFDVSKGTLCSSSDYKIDNSKTGYNGIKNQTKDQNSCLKFYKLSETENTINLILDHNTTAMIAWNSNQDSSDSHVNGPVDALNQLKIDTNDWKGTNPPTPFELASYKITYAGYKARLLTAKEVANVSNHKGWPDGHGGHFFLDTNNKEQSNMCTVGNTTGCKYGWLYDRTSKICKSTGCLNNSSESTAGYWTASTFIDRNLYTPTHMEMCNGYVSYGVSYLGRLGVACVNNAEHYGVRPVITISK